MRILRFALLAMVLTPAPALAAKIVSLSFDLEIVSVDNEFIVFPPPPPGPGTGRVRLDLTDVSITFTTADSVTWGGFGLPPFPLDPSFTYSFDSGYAGLDDCFFNTFCDHAILTYTDGSIDTLRINFGFDFDVQFLLTAVRPGDQRGSFDAIFAGFDDVGWTGTWHQEDQAGEGVRGLAAAIPEPSAALAFGIGALLVGVARGRRPLAVPSSATTAGRASESHS